MSSPSLSHCGGALGVAMERSWGGRGYCCVCMRVIPSTEAESWDWKPKWDITWEFLWLVRGRHDGLNVDAN